MRRSSDSRCVVFRWAFRRSCCNTGSWDDWWCVAGCWWLHGGRIRLVECLTGLWRGLIYDDWCRELCALGRCNTSIVVGVLMEAAFLRWITAYLACPQIVIVGQCSGRTVWIIETVHGIIVICSQFSKNVTYFSNELFYCIFRVVVTKQPSSELTRNTCSSKVF